MQLRLGNYQSENAHIMLTAVVFACVCVCCSTVSTCRAVGSAGEKLEVRMANFPLVLVFEKPERKKKKNPESRKSSVSDCDGLDFQKSHSGCILTWILDRMKNRQRFNSLCVKSSNWKPLYTTLSSSPLARRLRHSGHRPRSWRSTVLKTLPLSPPDHSDRYLKKFSKGVLDCSWRLNLQEGSQVALPLSLM